MNENLFSIRLGVGQYQYQPTNNTSIVRYSTNVTNIVYSIKLCVLMNTVLITVKGGPKSSDSVTNHAIICANRPCFLSVLSVKRDYHTKT